MNRDERHAREMAEIAVSALDKDTRLRLAMLLGASMERLNEMFLGGGHGDTDVSRPTAATD